ncbi:MAG TPA: chorismate mutase [Gammaproteobacteria bacterium]|nr:chorismate mutase [Gammaproteobacteria bacterium]
MSDDVGLLRFGELQPNRTQRTRSEAMNQPTVTTSTYEVAQPHIEDARQKIDSIDQEIIRLLLERENVSTAIQLSRVAAGSPRLQIAREVEVVKHYVAALGNSGGKVAISILELCRGGRADVSDNTASRSAMTMR